MIEGIIFLLCCALPAVSGFARPSHWSPFINSNGNLKLTHDAATQHQQPSNRHSTSTTLYNLYDDWAGDLLSSSQSKYTYDDLILPLLDEESVEQCLEELMDSEYGKTMFGKHDVPASVG